MATLLVAEVLWPKAAVMCLLEAYMQVRCLDDNRDYCFGRAFQNYIGGVEAVGQAIMQGSL